MTLRYPRGTQLQPSWDIPSYVLYIYLGTLKTEVAVVRRYGEELSYKCMSHDYDDFAGSFTAKPSRNLALYVCAYAMSQ